MNIKRSSFIAVNLVTHYQDFIIDSSFDALHVHPLQDSCATQWRSSLSVNYCTSANFHSRSFYEFYLCALFIRCPL